MVGGVLKSLETYINKWCWERRFLLKFTVGCCLLILSQSNINSLLAQKVHISTDLLGYINFGTINGEIGLGLSQHFSVFMQGKYNPFEYKFKSGAVQINNRRLSFALGGKYWPWHIYSGWFLSGHGSWVKYNMGGIFGKTTYQGWACGVTLAGGYSLMIRHNLNMEFGAGVMAGYTDYIKYSCPSCGRVKGEDERFFLAPDNVIVQLSFIF